MSDSDIKSKTQYLLELLEKIQRYRAKYLSPERIESFRESDSKFHDTFDQLPYDEQQAFVALLASTEMLSMTDCEALLARARQREEIRKIVESFEAGYVGMTNQYTPAVALAMQWDSIIEENR